MKKRSGKTLKEETDLDFQDWDRIKEMGKSMVTTMVDYLATQREQPAWQEPPGEVKVFFNSDVPIESSDPEEIFTQFKNNILPYNEGTVHPRYWGWVEGTGTVIGMLADLLASGLNTNAAGGEHSPTYVELEVLDWFKSIFNFPNDASGMIVSGGTMANLNGLTVARNAKLGNDFRSTGGYGQTKRAMIYCSDQAHSSIEKSVELLGFGSKSLKRIPTNEEFEINTTALENQIVEDKENGFLPICVVATVGTTNTGAFDDLEQIVNICNKYDLWLHVDGAFGSLVKLTDTYKHLVDGIEKVDSLAFDFHKWLMVNYNAGCCLVRDADKHINTFSNEADYLEHDTRGLAGTEYWLSDFGIELSRDFKALKVWIMMKVYGINSFAQIIEKNINQAKYLSNLINETDELELMAPVKCNIVCFRYNHDDLSETELTRINREIMFQIQESGFAVISSTQINEKFTLRASITNHRTRFSDIELLVNKIMTIVDSILT